MTLNYSKIGLKAGLEIHQQLNTQEKLFCSCQPQLFKEEPKFTFLRRLRPTQSELGQVDPAALFEFQKGTEILYETDNDSACLVEMDEEPPHNLNPEAVEISILASLMMNAKPVDEIHVMRKTVIDGSNTTGFQRTCVVALNGEINIKGKKVPIQHISLEEDAARKTGKKEQLIHYRIDRLGIPLIEVATAPVIYSPEEAEETAFAIGRILRVTRRVKRGLGTIRQDLNVSIKDGALIEIKGVQELALVSKIIENEVQRQLSLLEIRDELKKRGINKENIIEDFVNVTSVFKQTKCKVIGKAIKENKSVFAVRLPGFTELLKRVLASRMRFGSELAGIARFWGRVGGIFHTDEMPAYGITFEEINQLGKLLKKDSMDAVVFVSDTYENATAALKAITDRAKVALEGVPEETRAANPDGTTKFMRPRPGAARMYPETDVPPIQLTKKYLEELHSQLPELPEQLMKRLMDQYKLNTKLAEQILNSEYLDLFESSAKETKVSPTVIAVALTETLKALKRDGVNVEVVSDQQFREIFMLVGAERTAKESIPELITWLSNHDEASAQDALESLGLRMITGKELEELVDDLIKKNRKLVEARGKDAIGLLMGMIMKKARGRVKPGVVNEILERRLE